MNINYIDFLDNKYKAKSKIKKIYNTSFPKSEKFPFWILKKSLKSKNVNLYGILYNNKIIGMQYILHYNNEAYLMYFAIDEKYRNIGYGSILIKNITKRYHNVILSIERVVDKVSKRRKNFYIRNGFNETDKFTIQNNIHYEILCSNNNYNLTKDKLINLYSQMSKSKILRYIMNKRFNLMNIDFIEN